MSEAGRARAVVAGHGAFAEAMLGVVARIAGATDAFVAVSNEGKDARGIEDALRAALAAHGARVIFTDLPAGSCTMAARKIMRDDPGIALVTGASVPMLLEFAFGADPTPAGLQRLAERTRAAIQVHPQPASSRAD